MLASCNDWLYVNSYNFTSKQAHFSIGQVNYTNKKYRKTGGGYEVIHPYNHEGMSEKERDTRVEEKMGLCGLHLEKRVHVFVLSLQ